MDDQILYEDTRQQANKHNTKNAWWNAHGVTVIRKKLDAGDYMLDGSNILVDTKRNIQEVAMDCGRDHARFAREMDRARDAGYRLVILIETTGNYHCVADVARWENDVCRRCDIRRYGDCTKQRCTRFKRRPMTGETLSRIMAKMEADHGCRFEFAHPKMAAKRICDLLGVSYETGR